MSSNVTRLESLLQAVPDALVGMDQAGVIRFVNHQTEALFGYDRDNLVGLPINALLPKDLWRIYTEHKSGYFADPRSRSMGLDLELVGRRQDGSDFPVNVELSHIDTGDVLLVIVASGEVTRRRQAIENAHRLAAIVESSEDAIVGITRDGLITSWNPASEQMYGYPSEEVIGRTLGTVIPKDRPDELSSILAKVRAGQGIRHLDTIRIRKDGTAISVSLSVSSIRDADGAIVGASLTARDLTESRQAFDSARTMIESSLDSLVAIGPEGKITDVNEATVNATGIPREELIGTAFSAYFAEPDKAEEIYQRVFADGMAAHYPLTILHRDGTETEVLFNASVYRDAEGEVLGVFAAARDVSQVRRAFESARSMIESSLDSLVAISPEGMITDLNETTVKVTGTPREELIGTAFSDYFTDPEKANAIYQLVFAEGMAVDYPLTILHRNGTLTEVRYNASVYRDSAGEVLGVFAAARDVTQQNQAERSLAEQRVLERGRLAELERFHERTIGREIKMIELKKEIETLTMLVRRGENGAGDQQREAGGR